jgi:hypothetical protein
MIQQVKHIGPLRELLAVRTRSNQPLRNGFNAAAAMAPFFALICCGCAANNPLLSSGLHPRVEDCALVQQATPSRYVCDGKIYTSVQLDEISRGEHVQLSEQASHGAFPGNVIEPTGNFGTYTQPAAPATPGSAAR